MNLSKLTQWFCFTCAFLVLCIAITRAWEMGITYDEAYTILYHSMDLKGVITITIANNHILNSFFAYLVGIVWPFNEFVLRIPNLISGLIFLVVMFKISREIFKKNLILFLSSILLLLSGFQLYEMFSIVRGYGISCALVSLATYYIFKYKSSNSNADIYKAIYILLLASLAQLVSFFILTAVIGLHIFSLALQGKNALYKEIVINKRQYLLFSSLTIFFVYWGTVITREGAPVYSSTETEGTLINSLLRLGEYLVSTEKLWPILFMTILLGWLISIYSTITLLKSHNKKTNLWSLLLLNPQSILIASLTTMTASNIIHHRGLIAGREILPLAPLIFTSLFCSLNTIYLKVERLKLVRRCLLFMTLLIALFSYADSLQKIEFDRTHYWHWEADDKNLILMAIKDNKCVKDYEVDKPVLDFYNQKFKSKVEYCKKK